MSVDSDNSSSTAPPTQYESNKSLNCRMYEKEYPDVDDLVVVQVKSIVDMGAYCSLLEYNGIEGMILMSELSRRRIRSVNRLIRVGRQEIVAVLRVNKEKGYIDLSKKRVSPDDLEQAEDRWNKSKAVHSILRHVAKNSTFGVEELYRRFVWPMAKSYDHPYYGLKRAMENRETFLTQNDVPKAVHDILFKIIEKRLQQQVVSIRCAIECTCFAEQGILAIKKALKKGLELSTDDFVVKIKLEAAPRYILTLSTLKTNEGMQKIQDVIDVITKEITQFGGHLVVKSPPKAMLADDGKDHKDGMIADNDE
eukprot:CAMPEP_0202687620 /NCGR_PEP_ID=MMETSP1385-20130828/3283_1 /ASSEMBLY_ACC=CAM_ASM_000861 /TAXON_ID=933848 /ORGANISM="Elphidium margaritaceum" /LENGTH=308 /DNA_ID=CAMNT_0049342447 /DNA_START=27 /DNA_END=953 /DNA_ORIENTATION=+